MNKFSKKSAAIACCAAVLIHASAAKAAAAFIVKDIKVRGLQRVSKGTVLNYLPVELGEAIGPQSTAEIIRALYDTGFFQSVDLERQGNTLVVRVVERATIGSISVSGNSEIPTDKMKEILKKLNLVRGRVYQRSSLEHLEKELKQVYNARGKYNARIQTHVNTLRDSRVDIQIAISEGRVSRIKEINIIGTHDFRSSSLLSELSLTTSNFFTYFTKKDQYSKTGMDASLEALRSYYLDRGYLKFRIVSSQVLLSPDKKDVFINIQVEEGPQYHFSGYEIAGNTILPRADIAKLIKVEAGEIFSRKKITESISAIGLALGDVGFGFPAINADPRIDEEHKTVQILFMIEPGRHVYVRNINFHGNTKTGDYVLRNLIRQDEGALLSLHNIKESERQLQMLNYLKNVNIKTTPLPESNNEVDLDIDVEEAPSAEANASVGYGSNGAQFNASFNQFNFLGTGRTVSLAFNASNWGQNYAFTYYNPFYTNTGVGRGINLYFEATDPKNLDVADYRYHRYGGDVTYNVLLSEMSSLQFGYGYQGLNIKSAGGVYQIQNFINEYGRNFEEIMLNSGWSRNSYDQMPYPMRGINQQLTTTLALPANKHSLEYYKGGYQTRFYLPIYRDFLFTMMGNVAYGNTFAGRGLPFYENYYAGGIAQPGQVRGFANYSLGPQDNQGNAMGANLLVNGSVALVLPYPLSRDSFRTSLFMDAGNVFVQGTPLTMAGTDAGPLRYSAGVSVEWRSPFGPLAFSLAYPLNKRETDETQFFQFSVTKSF